MATYNTAFGSLPGYNEQMGTTNTTGGGLDQQTPGAMQYQPRRQRRMQQGGYQQEQQPQQTFAQMQQQGQARPAPPPSAPPAQVGNAPSGNADWFGGTRDGLYLERFAQAAPQEQQQPSGASQQFQNQLQRQLQSFMTTPSAYNTEAFQQIRGAQAANLQADYQAQQAAMNEEMARRGLAASSVYSGRYGELAGQQARALSTLDAELLKNVATTQGADRAAALKAAQEFADQQNQLALQAAALTGKYQGGETLSAQAQANAQALALAGLMGSYGGQQTQAAKQFDVEQALKEKLGLGGLDVEKQKVANQAQQFTLSLQQQASDSAAERALREKMQTQQLTSQEAQQMKDIAARKDLQTQQLMEQARQFGLTLEDKAAERAWQGGFNTQELAIKRQQIDNELEIQNRQLTETERNNLALNALERDKLAADTDFKSQQLGLNRDELDMRAAQIIEDQRLKGVEIDNTKAYQTAEIDLRTKQIQNEATQAGKQIDLETARIQAQKDIANADNVAQMARLVKQTGSQETIAANQLAAEKIRTAYQQAAAISEQSGFQYTVDQNGNVVQAKDEKGNLLKTSAATQADLAREQQKAQFNVSAFGKLNPTDADRTLASQQFDLQNLQAKYQQAEFMSAITGKQYSVDDKGNLVESKNLTVAEQQRAEANRQSLAALTGQLATVDASGRTTFTDTLAKLQQALAAQEATGYVNVDGQLKETVASKAQQSQAELAKNQLLVSLAQTLQGLSADQIAKLLGSSTPGTTTTTTTTNTSTNPTDGAKAGDPPTGGTGAAVNSTYKDKYGYTWSKGTDGSWRLVSSPPKDTGGQTDAEQASLVAALGAASPEGKTATGNGGQKYKVVNGKWVLDTSTGNTGDENKGGTSTVSDDILKQLTALDSVSGAPFANAYRQSGGKWYQYNNGTYTEVAEPKRYTATGPQNSPSIDNVYPGFTTYFGGTTWVNIGGNNWREANKGS